MNLYICDIKVDVVLIVPENCLMRVNALTDSCIAQSQLVFDLLINDEAFESSADLVRRQRRRVVA